MLCAELRWLAEIERLWQNEIIHADIARFECFERDFGLCIGKLIEHDARQ